MVDRVTKLGVWGLMVGILAVGAPSAQAAMLDLTTASSSGTFAGAFWKQGSNQNVGTGNIDSFVRIQDGGSEQGYNTDGSPKFDTKSGSFTHSITLSEVPIVNISGTNYREFLLDINEKSSGNDPLLSLDELQIFLAAPGSTSQVPTTFNGSGVLNITGSLVYRLDASTNNFIKLNGALTDGSGKYGDMFAYIPDSVFTGAGTQQVYLYSKMGATTSSPCNSGCDGSGGFEEWAVRRNTTTPPPVVPEPTSLLLMSTGLMAAVGARGFRKRA